MNNQIGAKILGNLNKQIGTKERENLPVLVKYHFFKIISIHFKSFQVTKRDVAEVFEKNQKDMKKK